MQLYKKIEIGKMNNAKEYILVHRVCPCFAPYPISKLLKLRSLPLYQNVLQFVFYTIKESYAKIKNKFNSFHLNLSFFCCTHPTHLKSPRPSPSLDCYLTNIQDSFQACILQWSLRDPTDPLSRLLAYLKRIENPNFVLHLPSLSTNEFFGEEEILSFCSFCVVNPNNTTQYKSWSSTKKTPQNPPLLQIPHSLRIEKQPTHGNRVRGWRWIHMKSKIMN